MTSKRNQLLALIGGIRCTRTLLPSECTLVYFTNPLDYHQPICIRVIGINVNNITAVLLAYYEEAEKSCLNGKCSTMLAEDEFTAGAVSRLMESIQQLDENAKVFLSSAPHVVYNNQTGITVHSTYTDTDKLYPQTQFSLFEKGIHITTNYINDLIYCVPTKD